MTSLSIPELRMLAYENKMPLQNLHSREQLIRALSSRNISLPSPDKPKPNPPFQISSRVLAAQAQKLLDKPPPAKTIPTITGSRGSSAPTRQIRSLPQKVRPAPDDPRQQVIDALDQATFQEFEAVWKNTGQEIEPGIKEIADILPHSQFYIDESGVENSVIGYIMYWSKEDISSLLELLHLDREAVGGDDVFALLWLINVSPHPIIQNQKSGYYLSTLATTELQGLLGGRYKGPTYRAALLFASLTGYSAPFPDNMEIKRYDQVGSLPPERVWILALHYGIVAIDKKRISKYHPYAFVALQSPDPQEDYFYTLNKTNVAAVAKKLRIIIPPEISGDEQINHVLTQLMLSEKKL